MWSPSSTPRRHRSHRRPQPSSSRSCCTIRRIRRSPCSPGHRLSLAGLRLDPEIAGRQRTRRFTGLSVLRISDGSEQPLALPEGAQVSVPVWAPDGLRFAFTVDEQDGIGVWTGDVSAGAEDPVQVPGLHVRDVLGAEPPGLGGTVRWSRDGTSLYVLGSPQDGRRGETRRADRTAGQRGGRQASPRWRPSRTC